MIFVHKIATPKQIEMFLYFFTKNLKILFTRLTSKASVTSVEDVDIYVAILRTNGWGGGGGGVEIVILSFVTGI